MAATGATPGLTSGVAWSPAELRRGRIAFAIAAVSAFVLILNLGFRHDLLLG